MSARIWSRYAAWCRRQGGQANCHPGLFIGGAVIVIGVVCHFRVAIEQAIDTAIMAAIAVTAVAIAAVAAIGAARAWAWWRSWQAAHAAPEPEPVPRFRGQVGLITGDGGLAWTRPVAAREAGVPAWPADPVAPDTWTLAPAAPDNVAPAAKLDPVLAELEP